MDYTVDITIHTAEPITERVLSDVAELGGAAQGHPGKHRLETTLTVEAGDPPAAAVAAIAIIADHVAGDVVCLEVMTTAEHDRRLEEPQPRVVGVSEIAEMLGISKQRVTVLCRRDDFPRPLGELAAGPVWRAGDLSTFASGWHRRPGRPVAAG